MIENKGEQSKKTADWLVVND